MCLSRLGQIVYGALAALALALILGSLFTNGWKQFQDTVMNPQGVQTTAMNVGILPFACSALNQNQAAPSQYTPNAYPAQSVDYCTQWWNNQPNWMKVVLGGMIVGLVLTAASLLWNLLTFCACCCEGHILKPLPALAGMAAICLGVGVGVYYSNNQQSIGQLIGPSAVIQSLSSLNSYSYSFYMACGALVCCVANVVVGSLTVCLADKCL